MATPQTSKPLAQPLLGVLGTIISVGGAMAILSQISPATLASWCTLCVTSLVPLQFLIAVEWHHERPLWVARLKQPWRGLAFSALLMVAGIGVSAIVLTFFGGGVLPPSPFPCIFVIYTVMIGIWVVLGFGAWPMSRLPAGPGWRAVGALILIYSLTYLLYRVFFNFDHMRAAPFYDPALDPHGFFIPWVPITFTMTTVAALLTLIYFNFLPITALVRRLPLLEGQPLFGLLLLTFCVAIGGSLWWLGICVLKIDIVVFLARVDVAYVFGALMVINLFQMAPFVKLPQPWRGIALTLATLVLAAIVSPIYTVLAGFAFGGLASGYPNYDLELWIASALLVITFPLMTLYSGSFQFWPLIKTGKFSSQP